ncbi:MAG: NAD-glutamate dehydrogenase, partial [Hyphomonadaceae bacterium]
LDNHAPATAQLALHADIAVGLRRATIAMSRRAARDSKPGVAALITRYQAPVLAQRGALGASLTEAEQNAFDGDVASRVRLGAPEDLARDVAALNQLAGSLDIADLAAARQWPAPAVARLYHAVGAHFLLDRLRAGAGAIALTQHWERLALRRLLAELNEDQRRLAEAVLAQSDAPPAQLSGDWPARMTADWAAAHGATAAPVLATITEMQASGAWTFAKIVLAAAALRTLGAR